MIHSRNTGTRMVKGGIEHTHTHTPNSQIITGDLGHFPTTTTTLSLSSPESTFPPRPPFLLPKPRRLPQKCRDEPIDWNDGGKLMLKNKEEFKRIQRWSSRTRQGSFHRVKVLGKHRGTMLWMVKLYTICILTQLTGFPELFRSPRREQ